MKLSRRHLFRLFAAAPAAPAIAKLGPAKLPTSGVAIVRAVEHKVTADTVTAGEIISGAFRYLGIPNPCPEEVEMAVAHLAFLLAATFGSPTHPDQSRFFPATAHALKLRLAQSLQPLFAVTVGTGYWNSFHFPLPGTSTAFR